MRSLIHFNFHFSLIVFAILFLLGLSFAQKCNVPSKWATKWATPRYFQENRGTCWDFATVGMLEDSYRKNGALKGFLDEGEYVRFSEQAFGISMMNACAKHPEVCSDLGDFTVQGSTEGGEVYWLYSLGEVYSQLLPVSVCPYPTESGFDNEHKCDNYESAIASNPIKFNIKEMITGYDAASTKRIMFEKQSSVGWSSLMNNVYYYYPCSDPDWANKSSCSIKNRVRCPDDKNYNSEFCAKYVAAMYNQDGEFFAEGNVITEGGHAMVAVGFNDNFVTRKGYKGGFIIKNSWHDLKYGEDPSGRGARGSHSIKYWMQEISQWAERSICPNAGNPNNWLSCVLQDPGITSSGARRMSIRGETIDDLPTSYDISKTCLDSTYLNKITTEQYQATEFQCLDESFCSKDSKYRYFLIRNLRSVDGNTLQTSMLQYNTETKEQAVISTPYMEDSAIAYIFAPIDSQQEQLKNDGALCGYYFWPYELCDKIISLYGEFFSTYFEIDWEDSSYLKNASKFSQYDYSYLRNSTGILEDFSPICQNPWDNHRY